MCQEIYFKQKNSKATPPDKKSPPALMANVEVDVVDFDMEEDDLMNDDMTMDDGNADKVPTPMPKLKSTIMGGTSRLGDDDFDKTRGGGFRKENDAECNSLFAARVVPTIWFGFDALHSVRNEGFHTQQNNFGDHIHVTIEEA